MIGQAEWVNRKRPQMREHLGGGEGVGGSLCLFLLGLERPALPCPALPLLSTEPKALWYTERALSQSYSPHSEPLI